MDTVEDIKRNIESGEIKVNRSVPWGCIVQILFVLFIILLVVKGMIESNEKFTSEQLVDVWHNSSVGYILTIKQDGECIQLNDDETERQGKWIFDFETQQIQITWDGEPITVFDVKLWNKFDMLTLSEPGQMYETDKSYWFMRDSEFREMQKATQEVLNNQGE